MENEKELVLQSKNGDNNAFGVLYDHYVSRIYKYIYFKTFQKETAEDLTSQTFFKALKNIATVDSERSFSAWLYAIASNSVIDHYRKDKQNANVDDIWDLGDESVDIVHDSEVGINYSRVRKHLKNLASNERDIILMRVWQELSYKEIALMTGRSEASCKMVYSRAIKKLRDALPLALWILLVLRN